MLQPNAVICYTVLRKMVCADSFRSVACSNSGFSFFIILCLCFSCELCRVFEHEVCLRFFLVFNLYFSSWHDTVIPIGMWNNGLLTLLCLLIVRLVQMMRMCRFERFFVNLNFYFFRFWQARDCCCRCMRLPLDSVSGTRCTRCAPF